jgi:hypothetical protein
MMNEEQRQQIVLDAIKECANVSDPVQYAQMNYRVYQVAMRAVEMATSNDAKQTLIKKQMRDRYEFVKKQYSPIYAEVEVTFKDEMGGDDVSRTEIIKLNDDLNEDEDGKIFFYCNGIDELLKFTEPDNGEDFVITGFDDFYETL